MQEAHIAHLAALCHVPMWTCAAALLFVLVVQQRARDAVGEVLEARRDVRARIVHAAPAALALVALFVGCAAAAEREVWFEALAPAFECLGIAAVLGWCAPCAGDRVVGHEGVQLGWRAVRWEDASSAELDADGVRLVVDGVEERVALGRGACDALRTRLGA